MIQTKNSKSVKCALSIELVTGVYDIGDPTSTETENPYAKTTASVSWASNEGASASDESSEAGTTSDADSISTAWGTTSPSSIYDSSGRTTLRAIRFRRFLIFH